MSCNISNVYLSENVKNMVYDLHFRLYRPDKNKYRLIGIELSTNDFP